MASKYEVSQIETRAKQINDYLNHGEFYIHPKDSFDDVTELARQAAKVNAQLKTLSATFNRAVIKKIDERLQMLAGAELRQLGSNPDPSRLLAIQQALMGSFSNRDDKSKSTEDSQSNQQNNYHPSSDNVDHQFNH